MMLELSADVLDRVIKHPFTGLYLDVETESYMFFVCGVLVVQLSKDGKVLYAVEKDSVKG